MLLQTRDGRYIKGEPFRRSDVDYTTVSWTNPETGKHQVWSVPVEFIATFFEPVCEGDKPEYERETTEWLTK